MYCWNCGRPNPDDNAYCGACGRQLVRSNDPVDDGLPERRLPVIEHQHAGPAQTNPMVEEPRGVRETVVSEATAPLTMHHRPARSVAPSMFGLNEDSTDYDYLLEEDEPRSKWRGVLALILFAVIGLLIYKQWDVISISARKLAERAGVTNPPMAGTPNQGEPRTATSQPEGNVSSTDITVNSDQPPSASPPPADTPLATADPSKSAAPEPAAPATNEEEQLDQARSAATAPPTNAAPDDSQVELAQKYLQGRGVPQDCARGVSLLRSAAGKSNPKAQIQLGALYATGHCVTQDKAMAYRWFAQAQDLEPNNSYVSRNLNSLWSNMTQEERQRAESR